MQYPPAHGRSQSQYETLDPLLTPGAYYHTASVLKTLVSECTCLCSSEGEKTILRLLII